MFGKLREKYQKIVAPIGSELAKIGITPNAMTLLSVLAAGASGYAYSQKLAICGAALIVAAGVLDMFDGAIARAQKRTTHFGAVFDHVLDRYAEALIVGGMVYGDYSGWLAGLFALFGMLMASFARAKAESVGGLKSCTVGIAERPEKLFLLIGGSALTGLFPDALNYALILVGILSHITVIQRLHYTWTQTEGK